MHQSVMTLNRPQAVLLQGLDGQWLASFCQSLPLDLPRRLLSASPLLGLRGQTPLTVTLLENPTSRALVTPRGDTPACECTPLTLARKPPK